MFVNEDDGNYCNAWEKQNHLTEFLPSCSRSEFKYTSAKELDSMPYQARMDSYGGGGYVYHIKGSSKSIRAGLKSLQQQRWVNNHTRAIFLEFSVYNANVNLFGIATILAEFIPGGGIRPYWRFDPVRLLHHHETMGPFILGCEIIFIFYILFFTYKFIMEFKAEGLEYFSSYWSFADVTIIICAYSAIVIYGYR
jgi:polycystin 1L2